ncbi:MAG: cell wall-binding repeat-containing protein [Coriobacteriia bacterium]|nr:cell wall-binding repeat-containing protein [Coriobacteriia bacterium]
MRTRFRQPRIADAILRWTLTALIIVSTFAFEPARAEGTSPFGSGAAVRPLVVLFAGDGISRDDFRVMAEAGIPPSAVRVRSPRLAVVDLPSELNNDAVKRSLSRQDTIAALAYDRTVHALTDVPPDDTRYDYPPADGSVPDDQQSHLGPIAENPHAIGLETVWDAALNGTEFTATPSRQGVTVAVMDTGVTTSLMEDSGRYVPVWDYVSDSRDTSDRSLGYHGTTTASIIAAQTDNSFGIAGTLYSIDNKVLVYRVLDRNRNGEMSDVMQAMMDAADRGTKVISLSLGHRATTVSGGVEVADTEARALWQQVVDYCTAQGTLVVAASGNGGNTSYPDVYYPAACDGVIAVGSIDPKTGNRSGFSSFGPELDVVAPGRDVWAARPNDSTGQYSGTSFAAPVVAGTIAFLWSLVPALTPATLTSVIQASADSSYGPSPGFDPETGYGKFDAEATYATLKAVIPSQPPVAVSVRPVAGREVVVSWSAAAGSGVFYRYSAPGTSTYTTTERSGRLILPSDGLHTVSVHSYASDRWGAQSASTATVSVSTGQANLVSTRREGSDRYRTAAAISRSAFPTTAPVVVVASGANWPDGLTGAALAALSDGPILLTRPDKLSLEARDEILRLAPSRVYVLGGTSAVSTSVTTAIASLPHTPTVTRIGGADRYDTARLVALEVNALRGPKSIDSVIVASGQGYPDALSISSYAAASGTPVLLTRAEALPTATQAALAELKPTTSIVVGGNRVVSGAVFSALPSPRRLAGADRYSTSRAIADYCVDASVLSLSVLGVATGLAFPDALAAGPALAATKAPLLLMDSIDQMGREWLGSRGDSVREVVVLGGPSAAPYQREFDMMQALRGR